MPPREAYKYPEKLNIFLAPFTQTAFIGGFRLVSVVVLMVGTVSAAPAWYLDDATPNWTVPLVVLFSAAPFIMAAAFGPTVANITVHLPSSARRSKESLMAFANNVHPNTRLTVKFIRFAPWLATRNLFFADLRRLPISRVRLSNFEHVPLQNQGKPENKGVWGWMARMYFGRYWVNMTGSGQKNSSVPGAWEKMWEQIPWSGEEEAKALAKLEKKAMMGGKPLPISKMNRSIVRPTEAERSGRRR
ncbi:hypothetical protein LTR27_007191 [Elasticomyces elasticus]|nr:hypothetical protein LTR27_007191 [Elasticomyces elasticus]